jgi:cytidylate kinase
MIIAIDGPAGAGKSTVAKRVSQELDYMYIDTGAIYRTIALGLMSQQVNIEDAAQLEQALSNMTIDYKIDAIYLNQQCVTEAIRQEKVSQKTSEVSKYPAVRKFATHIQQQLSMNHHVVLEGRDIGTIVFPNADYKFFLTADATIRGKRRFEELKQKGIDVTLDQVVTSIMERDHQDTTRQHSPLKKSEDAVVIDTSDLDIDQVVDLIIRQIKLEG